jgi:hypothetical protein
MYGSCHPIQNHMWKLFIWKLVLSNVKFANRELQMFILQKHMSKIIWITIYKFKISVDLWQIYGSCHPVQRNVKIVHLKTGLRKNIFLTNVWFMSSSWTKHSNSYENRASQNWLSQKWKYLPIILCMKLHIFW